MAKQRYFDHAATTPLRKEVLSAMLPYFSKDFGNPSNLYGLGLKAFRAVRNSTETIANILGCKITEFVYTGSATESDNLAILGVARTMKTEKERSKDGNPPEQPGRAGMERLKILISEIEHKGSLAVCEVLEKEARLNENGQGFEIVKLPVAQNGLIDLEFLKKELDERTILVSVTMADSETGTIQPISQISEIIRNFRESRIQNPESGSKIQDSRFLPYLHIDASQAAGYLDLDVDKLGVDLMTLSAHKIYGPKGIGGLYVRKGVKITPLIYGGGQQGSLRSGTENVPSIVGFAKALELAQKNRKKENSRLKKMRDALQRGILKSIPKVVVNGHLTERLPGFLNVSILDVEGEAMLLYLDELGIMINTGSACNSQSLEPSYVLTALGNPYEYVHGSIRFTLGESNTMDDVRYVLKHLPPIIKKLRSISPLNLKLGQTEDISDPRAFIGKQTPHFVRKAQAKNKSK